MALHKLLIANRGEIAIRIARGAAEFGLGTVAVYSTDDADSLHTRKADEAYDLGAEGAPAYLDIDRIIDVAKTSACDAIHPGYGFLSENAEFALRCEAAGIHFVGPRPEILALFGNKVRARALAAGAGVPVLRGSAAPISLDEARAGYELFGVNLAVAE
jgi:pyruvate carboxylase